ncbi:MULTISPECIES: ribosome small subunit-dependent GTPase A [unclassified Streptomyces]|uniref:ribosome small subunit-dependent GTPase A n=1 Tax=unclassified Streptomyces TaxID=2593676 RepID=UPI002442E31B|nr:ribosome small subunit-dependent GTPase A [Streptomyces sp. DH41]MDG9723577.1 ribosome small subunit-dependent GTPase A [Streptomyces sp. DH41]
MSGVEPAGLDVLGWRPELAAAWDEGRYEEVFAGACPGRVGQVDRGACTVLLADGTVRATPAARVFRPEEPRLGGPGLATGDWVAVAGDRVEDVLPRHSAFVRGSAGARTEAQIVAANVDTVFVVVALTGDQRLRRVERYLAVAWQSGAQPVVVLSKADLHSDPGAAAEEIEGIAPGTPVHTVSSHTGDGLDALEQYAAFGRTVALVGLSGVGKSTLVNRLSGMEQLTTQEVRGDFKGRHTTTHRELVTLPGGGLLIDTPGMRGLAVWDAGEGIDRAFSDIEELTGGCRFRDCTHGDEPGCAVSAAVGDGALDEGRLGSWHKLRREQRMLELRQDARARAEDKQRVRTRARALKKRPHR